MKGGFAAAKRSPLRRDDVKTVALLWQASEGVQVGQARGFDWSLHRPWAGSSRQTPRRMAGGSSISQPSADGLDLLDLPAELRRRGYDIVQICHFHLPSRSPPIWTNCDLRCRIAIDLDALLIDDGDLSNRAVADRDEAWIGGWLDAAVALGARRARVCAGRSAPSPAATTESAVRLGRLAASHPGVRVITENWLEMTPNADAVLALLAATGDAVGLMIDLGIGAVPKICGTREDRPLRRDVPREMPFHRLRSGRRGFPRVPANPERNQLRGSARAHLRWS